MTRPLLITDCDEVLLHMVSHFRDWLDEVHGVDFAFETGQFEEALVDRSSGEALGRERVTEERQQILETVDVTERVRLVSAILSRELEVFELGSKLQSQVQSEMEKGQREWFLRHACLLSGAG